MLLLWFIFGYVYVTQADPEDYQAIFERLRLAYYAKHLVADKPAPIFSVGKYNRTANVLNASLVLLEDLDGREIVSTTKAFLYLNNRYKFTGIQLKVNVCEMWMKNLYGIRDIMEPCGNIQLCDIKKGPLYIRNFWPNPKYFPKTIPVGSYKIELHSNLLNGTKLVQINWYGKAELYFEEMRNKDVINEP
ncbi:uncharacterized protein LOC108906264 [Anoplophora glabripennis]|uniref:uncharacterized protein LOC108906264 n=1 Tax=Anoplophora glabripennis TaxID=217634 RepID=UPI0008755FC4|nr:uncharacterized protein LOC108906264 [Anoplophora glabripennis]